MEHTFDKIFLLKDKLSIVNYDDQVSIECVLKERGKDPFSCLIKLNKFSDVLLDFSLNIK